MTLGNFALTDKVALVTGASRGIGRAIATAMAEAGANVVLVARKPAELEQAAGAIRDRGRKVLAVTADVSLAADVTAMVDAATKEFGRLDILVNNAGICPFIRKSEELREDGWDKIMAVNLKGVFLCTQAAARVMIPQRSGAIISISSLAGIIGDPGMLPYSVSKAGVISMTKVLAAEWAQHNIRVNAIAPGLVGAGMNENLIQQPALIDPLNKNLPFKRPAKAEEIANVAVFLASDAASYMTGQTVVVDGGAAGFSSTTIATMIGKLTL